MEPSPTGGASPRGPAEPPLLKLSELYKIVFMSKVEVPAVHSGKDSGAKLLHLHDILKFIDCADEYFWAVLFVKGVLKEATGKSITDVENLVNKAENGISFETDDLIKFSEGFFQMIDVVVIGSKDREALRRYSTDNEMYAACDWVIELVDSTSWLIHSKVSTLEDIKSALSAYISSS